MTQCGVFRNCFLGPELQVKLGDLAIVCANFHDDYGEVRGRKPLPIRWLPWENLVLVRVTVNPQWTGNLAADLM